MYKTEFDQITLDADPIFFPQGGEIAERGLTTGVIEVVWGNVAGGYSVTEDTDKSSDEVTDIATFTVAWAPSTGWAYVYRYVQSETVDTDGFLILETTGNFIGAVHQF